MILDQECLLFCLMKDLLKCALVLLLFLSRSRRLLRRRSVQITKSERSAR